MSCIEGDCSRAKKSKGAKSGTRGSSRKRGTGILTKN